MCLTRARGGAGNSSGVPVLLLPRLLSRGHSYGVRTPAMGTAPYEPDQQSHPPAGSGWIVQVSRFYNSPGILLEFGARYFFEILVRRLGLGLC